MQFIMPTLKVGGDHAPSFKALAAACGETVEAASFDRAHSDPGRHPVTLVSIAFHVPKAADDEDSANSTGRLITERFLSLVSYAIGERVTGVHQQVSVLKDDGSFVVRLHPQRTWADGSRRINLSKALLDARPDPETFKALFWLRRGLSDRDPIDAFAALMVALEILASVLLPSNETVSRCPNCKEEIGRRTTSSIRQLVTETLGGSSDLFDRLWSTRNAVVAHGGRAVTASVLQELVDLRFEAVTLVFRAVGLALGLPPESAPRAAPIGFFADPFLKAE